MTKTYTAFIGTKGNFPFRDTIKVDERLVTFQKRNIIGYTEQTMSFSSIAQVSLIDRAEVLFSRIDIISTGGSVISISGLMPADARELKGLLDRR